MIKINDTKLEYTKFGDGTPNIKMKQEFLFLTSPIKIEWLYYNMEELFVLQCVKDWLDELYSEEAKYELFMPYVPNGRQDRAPNGKDVFTLKTFCARINGMNFDKVTIVDPHSRVSPSFLQNVNVLTNADFIEGTLRDIKKDTQCDYEVFFPDSGAYIKYFTYIKNSNLFGVKVRDWDTGFITDYKIEGDVKGKNILIVDDICSYGNTFVKAAEALEKAGATDIRLAVTFVEDKIYEGGIFAEDSVITEAYAKYLLFDVKEYEEKHGVELV